MALHLAPTSLLRPCAPARLPGGLVKCARLNGGSVASQRCMVIVAAEGEKSSASVKTEEILNSIQDKWGEVENKNTIIAYGVGALVALWVTGSILSAFNSIPFLPKILQLVGLVYASWFVYRYLLFKESRSELADDLETLKKKVTGEDS